MPAIGTVVSLATATAEAVAALDAAVLYTRAVAEMHRPARGRRGTRPVRPAGVEPADVLALRGNLAELHHTVVLLARCAKGGIVELDNLPRGTPHAPPSAGHARVSRAGGVADAMRAAGGNRSRTAQALGIGRNTKCPTGSCTSTTRLRFT